MNHKYKFNLTSFLYTFFFCCFILSSFTFQIKTAYTVKIVATVNDDVITDVDVDEFEQILCKMDKRFGCGSQNSRQIALMTLVESVLKMEHFQQMNLFDDKQINRGFSNYKNEIIKNLGLPAAKLSKIFENYLHAEYLWSIMMSSRAQGIIIKDTDVKDYIKQHDIKKKTSEQIKQLILQEKINDLSQNTISDLRKFYLVEIRGL